MNDKQDVAAPIVHRARSPVEGMQSCEDCGAILINAASAMRIGDAPVRFWPTGALVEEGPGGVWSTIDVGAPTCRGVESDPVVLRRLLDRANAIIADQRRTITEQMRQRDDRLRVIDETRDELGRKDTEISRLTAALAAQERDLAAAHDALNGHASTGMPLAKRIAAALGTHAHDMQEMQRRLEEQAREVEALRARIAEAESLVIAENNDAQELERKLSGASRRAEKAETRADAAEEATAEAHLKLDAVEIGAGDISDRVEDVIDRMEAAEVLLTPAARLLLDERARQSAVEGWTTEHDDEHARGELAIAAAIYAVHGTDASVVGEGARYVEGWIKPRDEMRNLVRAGALILAEIERLRRKTVPRG